MRRPTGVIRAAWAAGVGLALLGGHLTPGASSLAAQGRSDLVELEAQGLARIYDNFFRVGEGSAEDRILAWTAMGRLTLRPGRDAGIEVFAQAEHTVFEGLGESYGFGGGVRLRRNPHVAHVQTQFLRDWPSWDVGDAVRLADVVRTVGSYSYRVGSDWVFAVDGHAAFVTFRDDGPGESRVFAIGPRVRFSGLTYRFQPEIGAELGWRLGDDPNVEEQRHRIYGGLVLMPVDALWMNLQYRHRSRAFPEADSSSLNFGRADEGEQWTVDASLSVSSLLHFTARYNRIVFESSVPGRGYSAQVLTVGTVLRF